MATPQCPQAMSAASRTPAGRDHPVTHLQSHHNTPAPPNRALYEWTVEIVSAEHELSRSYSVLIFLDHVPDNPKEWEFSPNYVGSHVAYTTSLLPGWEKLNLRPDADLIHGSVPLNHVIEHRPELQSLEPEFVVPYLTKNMHWRVLKGYEPAKLDSLEVIVYAAPLSYPPGAIHPVWGKERRYDGITYGRDGGSRRAPSHCTFY